MSFQIDSDTLRMRARYVEQRLREHEAVRPQKVRERITDAEFRAWEREQEQLPAPAFKLGVGQADQAAWQDGIPSSRPDRRAARFRDQHLYGPPPELPPRQANLEVDGEGRPHSRRGNGSAGPSGGLVPQHVIDQAPRGAGYMLASQGVPGDPPLPRQSYGPPLGAPIEGIPLDIEMNLTESQKKRRRKERAKERKKRLLATQGGASSSAAPPDLLPTQNGHAPMTEIWPSPPEPPLQPPEPDPQVTQQACDHEVRVRLRLGGSYCLHVLRCPLKPFPHPGQPHIVCLEPTPYNPEGTEIFVGWYGPDE